MVFVFDTFHAKKPKPDSSFVDTVSPYERVTWLKRVRLVTVFTKLPC